MPDIFHEALQPGENHVIPDWVVDNDAARLALVVTEAHVGKVCRQRDDLSFWALARVTGGLVWSRLDNVDAGASAPPEAEYLVSATHAGLSAERVLQAGAGILLTPTAGALTVTSTITAPPAAAGFAPPAVAAAGDAGTAGIYATGSHTHAHGAQALGAGTDHALATTTVAGFLSGAEKVRIAALPASGAAPVDAEYLVSTANGTLSAERVLTAGAGISLTPAAGLLTIASTAPAGAPTDAEYLVSALSGGLSAERVLTAGTGVTVTPAAGLLTVATPNAVQGPASATANAIARYDLTTGKLIKNSAATLADTGVLSAAGLTITGASQTADIAVTGNITLTGLVDTVDVAGANAAEYLVGAASAYLPSERVLQAGAGITLTPGAGSLTVASTVTAPDISGKADKNLTIIQWSSTDLTLDATHNNAMIKFTGGEEWTELMIPSNAMVPLPVGYTTTLAHMGASEGYPVQLHTANVAFTWLNQWSSSSYLQVPKGNLVTLMKIGPDEWVGTGGLEEGQAP